MLVLSLIIVIKENMILKIRCLNGDSATRLDSTRLVSSRVEWNLLKIYVESSRVQQELSRVEPSRVGYFLTRFGL
jgi:hypothetical protein